MPQFVAAHIGACAGEDRHGRVDPVDLSVEEVEPTVPGVKGVEVLPFVQIDLHGLLIGRPHCAAGEQRAPEVDRPGQGGVRVPVAEFRGGGVVEFRGRLLLDGVRLERRLRVIGHVGRN